MSRRYRFIRRQRVLLIGVVVFLATLIIVIRPVVVQLCLWRGTNNLQAREHGRALNWLRWAELLSEEDGELHYLLARVHRRLQRFHEVEFHLRQAHQLGWDLKLLEREQLLALAQTGQYNEVKGHWSELFANAADDGPEISNAYVKGCLSRFQLNDAVKVLSAWEADFPDDAQPHFMRGQLLEVLQNWAAAIREFQKALELAPERTDARLHLGMSLMRQSRIEEAAQQLRRCARETPANSEAVVAWANCLYKLGNNDRARQLLLKELNKEPNHPSILQAIGDIELSAGKPAEALKYLQLAVEQKPENRSIRYAYARALRATGQKLAAEQEFAIVNEGTKPLSRLGTLTNQLIKNPSNIELRYEVAQITWRYKSREEGARWFHSLLEIASDHAPTHAALAKHYALLGDQKRADYHRRRARVGEDGKK